MEPLRREVMAPRHPVGLLGPLFVLGSTLALTMAMAAMALAPRPRHVQRYDVRPLHRHHLEHRVPRAPVQAIPVEVIGDRFEDATRCGAPVYHARGDGTVDVTYEVCADRPARRR